VKYRLVVGGGWRRSRIEKRVAERNVKREIFSGKRAEEIGKLLLDSTGQAVSV
jgi:hypothetical protein